MSEHRKELAHAFLQKARNDLFTARLTLTAPDGPTDTPCFHAQQAVEKSIKALLTIHGRSSPKTHDLLLLLDATLAFAPELDPYREACGMMSAYAVEIRYPDDWFEPERQEAEDALKTAAEVVEKIEAMVLQAAGEE